MKRYKLRGKKRDVISFVLFDALSNAKLATKERRTSSSSSTIVQRMNDAYFLLRKGNDW